MVRRRKRKNPWKLASGFRRFQEALDRKTYLASRDRRKDQQFRIQKGEDPRYPWEVQYRKKY